MYGIQTRRPVEYSIGLKLATLPEFDGRRTNRDNYDLLNLQLFRKAIAMMTEKGMGLVGTARNWSSCMGLMVLLAALLTWGCGSDSHQTGTAPTYPTGISEDIEQQLKYDARVDSFNPEGEDLVVNVNDTWLHSPPGIRERALGHWYSLWQPAHSAASKIVIKFDGDEIERWSADKGYQPVTKENKAPTEG